ncbi:DUF4492 domain-containing protein [Campylobacter sp.]|uniref:DUF4492 domain-containing protein n=2 Tax=Campylobacter sp. TaxID=205 RepID=UPI002AA63162|nr:DUF4492 domain-containing protein [Campylobacter sp.]MCI7446504.1 DUF4492 domain-containing protein [Campylobacter sp.]
MLKIIKNIALFYKDGFANMRLGRTLWAVILIKLFVLFALLKTFIYDKSIRDLKSYEEKSQFVLKNLTKE